MEILISLLFLIIIGFGLVRLKQLTIRVEHSHMSEDIATRVRRKFK